MRIKIIYKKNNLQIKCKSKINLHKNCFSIIEKFNWNKILYKYQINFNKKLYQMM